MCFRGIIKQYTCGTCYAHYTIHRYKFKKLELNYIHFLNIYVLFNKYILTYKSIPKNKIYKK